MEDAEYMTLLQNGTWKLVPPSPEFNVVGNKWVFKLKRNADGSIQRYKARLLAKGFQQHPGIDFFETFCPVAKASTIRVVLAITVTKGWELRHLDFNNAFLNGQLIGDVYMAQPPGYVDTRFPNYICKLEKALYGLKQAPRAWNTALRTVLLNWGFYNSWSNTSLFILCTSGEVVFLLVYVDDVIITASSSFLIKSLIQKLDKTFALKDLGRLHYFLGIQIHYLESGFILNQAKYVDDLLHKLKLSDVKHIASPSVQGKLLSKTDGNPLDDPFIYRSIIGTLQYLMHTQPDIAYIVNHLS